MLQLIALIMTFSLALVTPSPLATHYTRYEPKWQSVSGAKTTITVTLTGDSTLGSEEYIRHQPDTFDSFIHQNGYDYPYQLVQEVFAKDDLTIINLEGVFYNNEANKVKKTYNFRAETDFAGILPAGSVEAAFLSNNHTIDYGRPGYESTLEALKGHGIISFGVSPYPGPVAAIYEKDGIRLGLTGAYISYWTSERPKLEESFKELKAAGCQAIIAVMHGGVEYSPKQGLGQEKVAEWLINQGADLVVGHHPHVLQGVDVKRGATILYSLGNFSFGGNRKLRADTTMIAQARLSFGDKGTYLGHQVNLIPARPSSTLQYNNFQPVMLRGEAAEGVIAKLQRVSPLKLNAYKEYQGAMQDFIAAAPRTPMPLDIKMPAYFLTEKPGPVTPRPVKTATPQPMPEATPTAAPVRTLDPLKNPIY